MNAMQADAAAIGMRAKYESLTFAVARMQGQIETLAAEVKQLRAVKVAKETRVVTPRQRQMASITEGVAALHDVGVDEIMSRTKTARISLARAFCFFDCVEAGMTKSEVARFFGVDHTSVLHGCRRVAAMIEGGEYIPETNEADK